MEFQKTVEINGEVEELIFIRWDDVNIRRFLIIGLPSPFVMQYFPVTSSWRILGEIYTSIVGYEKLFSDLIEDYLATRNE